MKSLLLFMSFFVAFPVVAAPEPPAMTPEQARAAVGPSLREMGQAANAHDIERHVGFYAHDASVMLIYDGHAIVGWDAIRDKQREWWQDGKSDVVYTPIGRPEYRVPGPGLIVTTLFIKSHRTLPSGEVRDGELAISDLWQQRPEGWRVIYAHESTSQENRSFGVGGRVIRTPRIARNAPFTIGVMVIDHQTPSGILNDRSTA